MLGVGGPSRCPGADADGVGLIGESARQRANLKRHLHRVVDCRVPRLPLSNRDRGIERHESDIGEAGNPQNARDPPLVPNENGPGASGPGGAMTGRMSLTAVIGRRTQSFSAIARQQTNATRPPGLSARRI